MSKAVVGCLAIALFPWPSMNAEAIPDSAVLEESGQLDNTIIVVSSDHGMPFPRAKANLYGAGSCVPLAYSLA